MWWQYVLGAAIGAAIGAGIGAGRSCETGACPLTSNPYTGAVYGGVMGLLLASILLESRKNAVLNLNDAAVPPISTMEAFKSQVLEAKVPVLVDCWAPWCGPCRSQMPIVEEVAAKAGERAKVFKVNVDEAGALAEMLGAQSIPTLVVFKEGKEVQRFVGVQTADVLGTALGI